MLARIANRAEEGVISLLLVGMVLLVFVEVVLRFGFNMGALWLQELTQHASAWMVLFGASYGVKVGAHIGIDAVVKLIPARPRRIVSMVAVLAALVYCGLFLAGGWEYLAKMYLIQIELEDMPIQRWVAHSILLIGFVLLAVRFVTLLWAIGTGRASGFQFADEAREALREIEAGSQDDEIGGGAR